MRHGPLPIAGANSMIDSEFHEGHTNSNGAAISRGANVLAIWDAAIRHMEATMPTPLGNHGESAMHPVHHAGLVWDMKQVRHRIAALEASPGCVVDDTEVDRAMHQFENQFHMGRKSAMRAVLSEFAAAPKASDTFHGIKLQVDQSLPPDVMELRSGTQTVRASAAPKASAPVEGEAAMEAWHSAVDDAGELFGNAPDERYKSRASRVVTWIKANRPQADPAPPVAVICEVMALLRYDGDLRGRELANRLEVSLPGIRDLARMVAAKDKWIEQLTGETFSDRNHAALQSRAKTAEQRAEAMAGLLRSIRGDMRDTVNDPLDFSFGIWMEKIDALLRDGLAGQEGAG